MSESFNRSIVPGGISLEQAIALHGAQVTSASLHNVDIGAHLHLWEEWNEQPVRWSASNVYFDAPAPASYGTLTVATPGVLEASDGGDFHFTAVGQYKVPGEGDLVGFTCHDRNGDSDLWRRETPILGPALTEYTATVTMQLTQADVVALRHWSSYGDDDAAVFKLPAAEVFQQFADSAVENLIENAHESAQQDGVDVNVPDNPPVFGDPDWNETDEERRLAYHRDAAAIHGEDLTPEESPWCDQ